jgi:hypothetical protein
VSWLICHASSISAVLDWVPWACHLPVLEGLAYLWDRNGDPEALPTNADSAQTQGNAEQCSTSRCIVLAGARCYRGGWFRCRQVDNAVRPTQWAGRTARSGAAQDCDPTKVLAVARAEAARSAQVIGLTRTFGCSHSRWRANSFVGHLQEPQHSLALQDCGCHRGCSGRRTPSISHAVMFELSAHRNE